MAGYTTNTLSELSNTIGGRNRWWTYETGDSLATVLGSAYISDATKKRMFAGDVIFARFGTLNTTGPDQVPSTVARGMVSEFASAPGFEVLMVDTVSAAGAATLKTARLEDITDNSGGVASATTGIVSTLATQTFVFYTTLLALANSQIFQVLPGFAGKITGAQFHTRVAATTASKLATATAQIAGTNITTGGVISLTSATATPTGNVIAGTAVTAQAFTAAQAIGFNISSVTAFVEGDGNLELTVVNTDLANAIATLIKF